jgi:hypothetical protein
MIKNLANIIETFDLLKKMTSDLMIVLLISWNSMSISHEFEMKVVLKIIFKGPHLPKK